MSLWQGVFLLGLSQRCRPYLGLEGSPGSAKDLLVDLTIVSEVGVFRTGFN